MQIINQKPIILSPVYIDNIRQDFEPREIIKKTLIDPLFSPVITSQPITITENNQPVTADDLTDTLIDCCSGAYNSVAEHRIKELFHNTLVYYNRNTNLTVRESFLLQSGIAAKLDEPSPGVIYTPATDVIPSAKQFIAGQCSYHQFFASLGYWARPNTLGFYFANEIAFDTFKQWIANEMLTLSSIITPDVAKMMSDLQNIALKDLTESLLLRENDGDNCEPCSFARIITMLCMQYTQQVADPQYGILPFDIDELISPKTIVFVNVEKHARATPTEIAEEWNMIKKAITQKPKMISNGKLVKLTTQARNLKRITQRANTIMNMPNQGPVRAGNTKLHDSEPTGVDIAKVILKVLNQMAFVNRSMNVYRTIKPTFNMPNRRDPDDYNKQGKTFSTRYKPDLHIYVDTSGSISEENYQSTLKTCIGIAKKLNIDIYFNSFSDHLSQTTKLNLHNRTVAQIYKSLSQIPKVTGGTEYRNIWEFINQSKKRSRELSIVITDFEYVAPTKFIKHPKNLYYVPCSKKDWNVMQMNGKYFCESMLHNDPNFRKHILC